MKGIPSVTGAKAPAGATSSDKTGERMEKKVGGVAMGMQDATGKDKQFNTGKTTTLMAYKSSIISNVSHRPRLLKSISI